MPGPRSTTLVLLATLAPCPVARSAAVQERRVDDAALEELAEGLAAYLEARETTVGVDAAQARVAEALLGLGEELDGAHPLRFPHEIGRALWLAQGYDDRRVPAGRVEQDVFRRGAFEESGMALAWRAPAEYDPSGPGHPLILAIPDAGERPAEHLRAHWTHRELLDRAVLVVPEMPADQESWARVVVAGRPGGIGHALAALRFATERLAVDFDRVYVVGRGKGVPVALALGNYAPQRFAGIVGRAGDAGEIGPENFGNLPVYFTGGGARATAFRDAARALGFDDCRVDPSGKEADVWAWILAHERRAAPARVTVAVGDPYPTRAYWLRIAPTATDARASGDADRRTNTIQITSHGVSHVTLYLNDVLVDLDRPVRVVCNGEERSVVVERHLPSALDMLHDGTSDPGALYVARAVLAATGPAAAAPEGTRAVVEEPAPREGDPELARAKGHVEYQGRWMHPDERALVTQGLVKDAETGLWLSRRDRERLAEGWLRQDLEWIPPEEAARVEAGLWRVDGEWLELDRANLRHARLDTMWRIPAGEVLVHASADREVALRAIPHMRRALEDLRHVFGAEPPLPLPVAVLRDEEQYDRFAAGDPEGRWRAAHAGRLHVIHSAFFAESWFPLVEGEREYRGMGVCTWDPRVPHGDLYGVHSARLAVGLSFVEALDPSPKAVRAALAAGPSRGYYDAFLAEKRLPAWLRWGGAVYAERFFRDTTVADGGDPWWARSWSLDNIAQRGGLRPLAEILALRLDPQAREDSQKLLIEAGLVVAFAVDGGCAPLAQAHAAFKEALVERRPVAKSVEALAEVLLEHEAELRAFAGVAGE